MKFKLKPLSEQTLVITGASSGIGLATARQAARAGARVFLIARNGPALARICEALAAEGAQAGCAAADVGDADQLAAAADAALARFGHYDSWVNVAGVAIYAKMLETPHDEHERLFRTNYWGVVNAANIAVPYLRRRGGGAFVTVASVVSDLGTPILGAYAASKHAIKGYIDSLRIELTSEGAPVSLTLIKPAGIGSPLPQHAANHMGFAAKAPPPAYGPNVPARAILSAVQHPRQEIIVGGAGALQVLASHFAPHLLDRVSGVIMPFLHDRRRRPSLEGNLWSAGADGDERSPAQRSRAFSLYTAATLHRPATLALAATAIIGGALWARRERSAP